MTAQNDTDFGGVQKFSLTTSPMIHYTCSFQIKVGRRTRKYRLSSRGDYPLTGLLQAAIEAYASCVEAPGAQIEDEDPWKVCVSSEYEILVIFITPIRDSLILKLYDYESGESKTIFPDPEEDGKKPTEVALVNYWDFANAVYQDAASVVAKQGFSGVYQGRNPLSDKYSHFGELSLPPIPFVWLAQLTRLLGEQQKPVWNLADEKEFIGNLEKFKRPQSEEYSFLPKKLDPGYYCSYIPRLVFRVYADECMPVVYHFAELYWICKTDTYFLLGARHGTRARFSNPDREERRYTRTKIDKEWVERLVQQLKNTKIPAIPEFSSGCDGTNLELEYHGDRGFVKYRCWDVLDEWKDIRSVAMELLEKAEVSYEDDLMGW